MIAAWHGCGLPVLPVLLLLLSCARTEPATGPAEPPAPSDDPLESSPSTPEPGQTATLTMHHVVFAEAAMGLEVIDAPHDTHAWDVGGVWMQTVQLSPEYVLRIVVRAGEGESLASLRRDYPDARPSRVTHPRVCGARASRIELSEPERFIECIEYADGTPSSPGYFPATTTVGVTFRDGDRDVLATWQIPTALRARYRAQEDRFFASLSCGEGV
jgi:hypothetical protein